MNSRVRYVEVTARIRVNGDISAGQIIAAASSVKKALSEKLTDSDHGLESVSAAEVGHRESRLYSDGWSVSAHFKDDGTLATRIEHDDGEVVATRGRYHGDEGISSYSTARIKEVHEQSLC